MDFAVDFDSTVVFDDFPNAGPEVPYAVEVLKELVKQGHNIILYTMRSGGSLQTAIDWYAERDIPLYGTQYHPDQLDFTTSNKCHCDFFIDDKSIGIPMKQWRNAKGPAVDWQAVMEILKSKGILIDT